MSSDPVPPVIGRYALYDVIASGGMASVHYGRQHGAIGFSRTVAIKRLHAQFAKNADFVDMFVDEAKLAARIRHPNVVPTLDVVAEDGELFLVMEYVHGESLARVADAVKRSGGRIPPRIVAAIVSGVLHGLHAAHEARDEHGAALGIVHRDVSPQNVLVGVDGVARVLDFGIAKASARLHETRQGMLKGKLAYMAPEHARQQPVDRRTDVYSATVVLWEVLTGETLFDGPTEAAVLERVLLGFADPPSSRVANLPSAFDEIVERGLHMDPAKRFGTAREMALAVERAVSPALPSEVGEWLHGPAGESLARRASRVAEIESGQGRVDGAAGTSAEQRAESALSSISVSKPVAGTGRGRPLALGGSLLVLVVVVAVTATLRRQTAPAAAASVAASATAAPVASSATSEPSADTASVSPPLTGTLKPQRTVPKHPKRPGAVPSAQPAPDCDPPFVRDATGFKVWKRECL
jgi:serine/threonine protein kinase